MKKMLLLATVLFALSAASAMADTTWILGKGGASWEYGRWVLCPIWSPDTCASVIRDANGNKTTVIFGWPGGGRVGGRFTYCPNPGKEVCGIVLEGPNPNGPSTHAFFGKGGARRQNNGTWTYCPTPANTICAIVQVGPPGTPITTTIYGSGGIRIYPDYTEYCPLDGEEVCATVTEIPPPPPPKDTAVADADAPGLLEQSGNAPSLKREDFKAMRHSIEATVQAPKSAAVNRDLD